MTDALTKAAQAALDALDNAIDHLPKPYSTGCSNAATDLRAALAAQQAPDLIPQDALFSCPQMGNSVTRVTQQAAQPVTTITECEACFTPDVCRLRGKCDHHSAEQLRGAAQPQQAKCSPTLTECPRCKNNISKCDGVAQQAAQPLAKQLSRGQIGDIVREHLRGLYYCGRVWEAWSVGTMSEDDFSPAEELDTADEIADSLWAGMTQASWAAQPPAQPDKEHNHE